MTPHSTFKQALLPAVILLMAVPQIASAQSSSQSSAPLSGLYACEALTQKEAQLTCFLTETAKLRAAESSGDVIAVEKETFAEIKKAEVEKHEKIKANPPKRRTLAIKSASAYGPNGYMRFTLENGEVWLQKESGRVRLGRAEPDMLTIKRASFGSFLARVNDKGGSIRVKQVK